MLLNTQLTDADRVLLNARLTPVQLRAVVAWVADAAHDLPPAESAALCDRLSQLQEKAQAAAFAD